MLNAALLALALNRDAPTASTYGPQPTPAATHAAPAEDTPTTTGRPGVIRPANGITGWQRHDDDRRGFACLDDDCKTTTPVYNTKTPLEQEQGRLGGR